jgi:hypothetical protein
MPDADDRIRDALRATAREPSTAGVAERVRAKRQRRQTIRKIEAGVLVAAVVAVVAVIGATALDDNDQRPEIAVRPHSGTGPVVRVTDGLDVEGKGSLAKVTMVPIDPDEGFVRGPLLIGETNGFLSFAAYDRVGSSWDYPPSRIIRVRPDGTVVDRVDLKGRIDSLAEGEGVRWALTHDKTVIGPEDFEWRVKRIGPNNSVASNPVPAGEQPAGDIVAGGGGVWVPVRDGVLRFDPATGKFAGKVKLSTVTDRRAVSVSGKFTYATDGLDNVRLDPASNVPAGVIGHVTVANVTELADAPNGMSYVQIGRNADGSQWSVVYGEQSVALPLGTPDVSASGDVVWVDVHGDARHLLQLDLDTDAKVTRTLAISRTGDDADVMVTFVSSHTLFLTAEGHLYRVQLSK